MFENGSEVDRTGQANMDSFATGSTEGGIVMGPETPIERTLRGENAALRRKLEYAETEARNYKIATAANAEAAMGYQDRYLAAKRKCDALAAVLREAIQGCPCSVRERDSGHHIDCFVPQAKAVLAGIPAPPTEVKNG